MTKKQDITIQYTDGDNKVIEIEEIGKDRFRVYLDSTKREKIYDTAGAALSDNIASDISKVMHTDPDFLSSDEIKEITKCDNTIGR